MVDFACTGADSQEEFRMDLSLPSGGPVIRVPHSHYHGCMVAGCTLLDVDQIRTAYIDAKARCEELVGIPAFIGHMA